MNVLILLGTAILVLLLGIVIGRLYAPERRPAAALKLQQLSYANALVGVLDGRDDDAIDALVNAVNHHTDGVEAYFALGALFRQRGEYERAVRVHQTLLLRRGLSKSLQAQVHLQLAKDFEAAGFLKRAIQSYQWVAAKQPKNSKVWEELSRLYERLGRWEHAVASLRRIERLTGEKHGDHVANILADQARAELARDNVTTARSLLRKALRADAESPHALDVLGTFQSSRGRYRSAAAAWTKAFMAKPQLAQYFVGNITSALAKAGRLSDVDTVWNDVFTKHPDNLAIRIEYARWLARNDPQRAIDELEAIVDAGSYSTLVHTQLATYTLELRDGRAVERALERLTESLRGDFQRYRCSQCGVVQSDIFWSCTMCRAWNSVIPTWGRRAGEMASKPLV